MNKNFTPKARIRILETLEKTFQNSGTAEGRLIAAASSEFDAMVVDGNAHVKPENSATLVTFHPDEFVEISPL